MTDNDDLREKTYEVLTGQTGPLYVHEKDHREHTSYEQRKQAGRFADRVADGEISFAMRDVEDWNWGALTLTNEVCETIEKHRDGLADDD